MQCLQAGVGRLEPYTDCWLEAMIGLILVLVMPGLQGQCMNRDATKGWGDFQRFKGGMRDQSHSSCFYSVHTTACISVWDI